MTVTRQFEEDCETRIRNLRHKTDENGFPRPTIFLMGLGFGVIAARIACTCAEIRR